MSGKVNEAAVISINSDKVCLAKSRGALRNNIEDRLLIMRRLGDDPQDFGRSRLLLKYGGQRLSPPATLPSEAFANSSGRRLPHTAYRTLVRSDCQQTRRSSD